MICVPGRLYCSDLLDVIAKAEYGTMTPDSKNSIRYSTDISAGGILIRDSRNVALLLIEGLTPNEIKNRVIRLLTCSQAVDCPNPFGLLSRE